MRYIIFLLVLGGCSHLTSEQLYYKNLYSSYCLYDTSYMDEATANHIKNMCAMSATIGE